MENYLFPCPPSSSEIKARFSGKLIALLIAFIGIILLLGAMMILARKSALSPKAPVSEIIKPPFLE